jgi:hypothetical protein
MSKMSTGAKVAIIGGAVLLVSAIGVGVWLFMRKKANGKQENDIDESDSPASIAGNVHRNVHRNTPSNIRSSTTVEQPSNEPSSIGIRNGILGRIIAKLKTQAQTQAQAQAQAQTQADETYSDETYSDETYSEDSKSYKLKDRLMSGVRQLSTGEIIPTFNPKSMFR